MLRLRYRPLAWLTVTMGSLVVALAVWRGDSAIAAILAFLLGVQVARLILP